MRIINNSGTIIAKVAVGKERTVMNFTNGGRVLTVPIGDQKSGTVNKTVYLDRIIDNFNPNEVHTVRIETVNSVQRIYMDNILIFEDATHYNWSQDFSMEFWANAGVKGTGNTFCIDYCKFGPYKRLSSKASVSGSEVIVDNDNSLWNTNGVVSDNEIRLSSETVGYAECEFEGFENVVLSFEMKIPIFAEKNTLDLNLGDSKVEIEFFGDKLAIGGAGDSKNYTYACIKDKYIKYCVVVTDARVSVFKDGEYLTTYPALDNRIAAPCVRFETVNTRGDAMCIRNIRIMKTDGTVIISAPSNDDELSVMCMNTSLKNESFDVVGAEYSAERTLTFADKKRVELYSASGKEVIFDCLSRYNSLKKVFAFDDLNFLKPIIERYTVE